MSIGQGNISFTDPNASSSSGGSVAWTAITGKPSTVQFMFVVGGPNNFASIVGAPAVPVAGATDMVTALLATFAVRMSRNGLWQMGLNPLDGNTFYTKVLASNVITFPALGNGEEIIIETIPL
jgi:hypothetical protein